MVGLALGAVVYALLGVVGVLWGTRATLSGDGDSAGLRAGVGLLDTPGQRGTVVRRRVTILPDSDVPDVGDS